MDFENVIGITGNGDVEMHCQFENFYEFLKFLEKNKDIADKGRIAWEKPVDYNRFLQSGCRYFESGYYGKALEEYQKARECNPVAITAVFEIAECYICLGRVEKARRLLLDNVDYFTEVRDAARFYRRMGYIAVEQHKYRLALSCYIVSGGYEESSLAKKEITYILMKKGLDFKVEDPEQELQKNGLPLIDAYYCDKNKLPEETKA